MADLRRSEEQEQLGALVARLLAKHSPSEAVRAAAASTAGYDSTVWAMLCGQIGVASLLVPERYGGADCSFAETAVVLEELGYVLAPAPLLSTTLAVWLLLDGGDADACARLLPGLASGELVGTVAWSGPSAMPGAAEPVVADGDRLSGRLELVLDGDTADVLLVLARDSDGLGIYELPSDAAGLRRTHCPTMDATIRLAAVTLEGCPAVRLGPAAETLPARLHAVAGAGVAALATGAARRGLDMTVAHTKQREQFGRPLASFQALKHRMADMLVQVETARSASLAAAVAVAEDDPALIRRTSVAKAWCTQALSHVAAETIQLHGGIAITWEHDAHVLFKRAHALAQLFGSAHQHRATLLAD